MSDEKRKPWPPPSPDETYQNLPEEYRAILDRVLAHRGEEVKKPEAAPQEVAPSHEGEEPVVTADQGPDDWEPAFQQQLIADEDAQVQRIVDAEMGDPTGMGLYIPPEHAKKIGGDIAKGIPETGKAALGSVPRLIRGLLATVEHGIGALPGSEAALDVADKLVPDWWRTFATRVTETLDRGAAIGADPETITGHFGKTGVDWILNLALLRKLGVLHKPARVAKTAALARKIIPVLQEAEQIGIVEFLLAGNEQALAKQTFLNMQAVLNDHPEYHDAFVAIMTSKNPDKDALVAQAQQALDAAVGTTVLLWIVPSFHVIRKLLKKPLTVKAIAKEFQMIPNWKLERYIERVSGVEEAAKEFTPAPSGKLRRKIPQKWPGAKPTTLREVE